MKRLAGILGGVGALALAACSSGGGLGPHPEGGAAGTDGGAGTGSAAGVSGSAGTGGGAGASGNGGQDAAAPAVQSYAFHSALNRDLDMLVMVDNSLSMKPMQNKLVAAFPALTAVLEGLPGGLPNLHLGVVSSTLGAGPFSAQDIPSCSPGGDQGTFQTKARGTTCATGSLMPGQNFIVASASGAGNNFAGSLADTFSCIAALGDLGCGFEHQFASVLRALGADGAPPPPTNANFLRPNAYLLVLLFTNEDDCSAPQTSDLFNPQSRFVSDPLGPLSSYRCNEFGHLCGGARPPRTNIPLTGVDLTGTCRSAEDGPLLRVADVTARLKALKPDPSKVLVAAIAGPPTPYIVETGPASLKDDPIQDWPQIRHSCVQQTTMGGAPEFADPAVRISELVSQFGATGLFQVICRDTLTPALTAVGQQIARTLADNPCLTAGTDLATCKFVDHAPNAQGMRVDTPLPSCADSGNTAPCWTTQPAALCDGGQRVVFNRGAGGPAPDLVTTATCKDPLH